jgi:polysaccharide pyruvyl transferase WcaK-like protein
MEPVAILQVNILPARPGSKDVSLLYQTSGDVVMVKTALLAGGINGNRGSEAMLEAAIGRIREKVPGTRFGIYSHSFGDDMLVWHAPDGMALFNSSPLHLALVLFPLALTAGFLKLIRFNAAKKAFPASIRFLWECDAALDFAGVSFIDSRIVFLPFNILSIGIALLLQVPLVKFSQAVGPFTNPLNRLSAKFCLGRCTRIYARGNVTLAHLRDLRLKKTNFTTASDIAFCHTIGDSITAENEEKVRMAEASILRNKKAGKRIIGIFPSMVISRGRGGEKYMVFMSDLADHLNTGNNFLVFLPNASKEHRPMAIHNNDLPLLKQLSESVAHDESSMLFLTFGMNTDAIKKCISCCDITVTSRFHAMIFSLSLEIPVFVIGWSHKYREVMNDFSLEQYVINHRNADVSKVTATLSGMLEKKEELRSIISRSLPAVRKRSYLQIEETITLLRNRT